jgi:hypothetical protein
MLFYLNTTLEITILNCIVNPEEFSTQNISIFTLFSICLFKGCGAYTINSDYSFAICQTLLAINTVLPLFILIFCGSVTISEVFTSN